MTTSLNKTCRKSLQEKSCIRLELQKPSEDSYLGIVLAVQRKHIVIQSVSSLEFDGYLILPKQFVQNFRQSEFESCQDAILKANGQIKNLAEDHWLTECSRLSQVILKLSERDVWPGIEAIFNKGRDTAYYQGPIVETHQKHFEIACYDAAGKWEQTYELAYSDIMSIEIESHYCQHFNRYMKEANPYHTGG